MRQIYANNAATTLASSIGTGDLSLVVVDGSKFPTPSTAYDYFLVTLESAGQIEICRAASVSSNVITLLQRGVEGTTPATFPAGSKVECRVTRDTLASFSTAFLPLTSVDNLIAPSGMYQTGWVINSYDTHGAPAVAVRKDDFTWRFLNYQTIATGTVTASTTTSVTTTMGISAATVTSGKYLLQFTSGTYAGYIRAVSAATATSISWATALAGAPANGTTLELLKANSAITDDVIAIGDDSLTMAIVFGE